MKIKKTVVWYLDDLNTHQNGCRRLSGGGGGVQAAVWAGACVQAAKVGRSD